MTTTNESFNSFLHDKNERYYFEKVRDHNYYFFKLPYDGDCDFIHIIKTYICGNNTDGKPDLNDKSRLGGIYVYSLNLLFNIGYDMGDFLEYSGNKDYKASDVTEYYKQLKQAISDEIVNRIEARRFNLKEAEKLVRPDDGDMQYYRQYRLIDCARQDFLAGKQFSKPEIHITYDTRCEYDIDAVLEYLRFPVDIIDARATEFMAAEKVRIYKAIFRAETHFCTLREIESDKNNPLHYQREIRRVIEAACVKTVNVTFERNGQSVTVKAEAHRLGWNNYVSDWDIVAADRYVFSGTFGHKHGGDALMNEITRITHGKKELYNKEKFQQILFTEVQ